MQKPALVAHNTNATKDENKLVPVVAADRVIDCELNSDHLTFRKVACRLCLASQIESLKGFDEFPAIDKK